MKKKCQPAKPASTPDSFSQSLNTLAQQLGFYVMVLRNASAKQQSLVDP